MASLDSGCLPLRATASNGPLKQYLVGGSDGFPVPSTPGSEHLNLLELTDRLRLNDDDDLEEPRESSRSERRPLMLLTNPSHQSAPPNPNSGSGRHKRLTQPFPMAQLDQQQQHHHHHQHQQYHHHYQILEGTTTAVPNLVVHHQYHSAAAQPVHMKPEMVSLSGYTADLYSQTSLFDPFDASYSSTGFAASGGELFEFPPNQFPANNVHTSDMISGANNDGLKPTTTIDSNHQLITTTTTLADISQPGGYFEAPNYVPIEPAPLSITFAGCPCQSFNIDQQQQQQQSSIIPHHHQLTPLQQQQTTHSLNAYPLSDSILQIDAHHNLRDAQQSESSASAGQLYLEPHHHHHHQLSSCSQAYLSSCDLSSNIKRQESGNSISQLESELKVCEWEGCGNTFLDMHAFVKHLQESHVNLEPSEKNRYYCLWSNCKRNNQEFNARYKLLIHMRVHSGEKPYPCNNRSCTKSFSRLENLKIHQRSHTGEKPYKCNFDACSKSFTNSSDRIKHHKTHKDPKPYFCSYNGCMKRYTDPSSLRKHLRSHKRSQQQHQQMSDQDLLQVATNQEQYSRSWTTGLTSGPNTSAQYSFSNATPYSLSASKPHVDLDAQHQALVRSLPSMGSVRYSSPSFRYRF